MRSEEYKGMKRVSKQVAKRAYNAGYEIGINAVNLRNECMTFIKKNDETFENVVNTFEFYNCGYLETGKYAKFLYM